MTETAFADTTGTPAGDVCVALGEIEAQLGQVSAGAFASRALSTATNAEVVAVLQRAAQVARHAEALMVEATAQVEERSSSAAVSERMTTDLGCRSVAELVQRSTRVSSRAATAFVQGARAVVEPVAVVSGEVLPAEFPAMRSALAAGDLGIDGLVAVTGPLARVVSTAGRAAHLAADEELAASARGDGVDGAPHACADDLRGQATVWAMYLDQDGAEPREVVAMRKRGVTLGVARDGVVPLRGNLLAEVAGQLQQIFDSVLNPKVADSAVADSAVADSEAASGPFFAPTADEVPDFPDGADADRRTAV
ncbi:hypothetical protein FHX49_001365 [Microbacterium endophyticum]|uniref:DUF222 domain-containing protein n=1 Tax=Microbacterium endophyticum TaxID=1526412 RepID=A0A7W4V416_9MICO|nr:DUF222 domain-containing protein [Microbacterium endophyticum]MBB2975798.1 hypothetical protein [Microbacterium endophyticum]NIK36281.1 hypothetical protein [Microbacterium endophyticum]